MFEKWEKFCRDTLEAAYMPPQTPREAIEAVQRHKTTINVVKRPNNADRDAQRDGCRPDGNQIEC